MEEGPALLGIGIGVALTCAAYFIFNGEKKSHSTLKGFLGVLYAFMMVWFVYVVFKYYRILC